MKFNRPLGYTVGYLDVVFDDGWIIAAQCVTPLQAKLIKNALEKEWPHFAWDVRPIREDV